MPAALKAQWVVKAGVIGQQPVEGYCRTWTYSNADAEIDRASKFETDTIFNTRRMEAAHFYLEVSDPRVNNWASLDFIWI